MKRRTALLSAGIAAGAVAAGAVGRTLVRRRSGQVEWIGALPPQQLPPVVAFDGTELAVRAAGDPAAPVLLLSHGFSLDSSVWCDVWPSLSKDFRVVTFDHRSHGESERAATGDLGLRAMGRDIASVLEVVSAGRPAVVVGHSMGAMAVLAMAEQRADVFAGPVAGVVLIGVSSSELVRGAMGSVTSLLRPRLGTFGAAARRVDRIRRAVMTIPIDVAGVVARATQFGPDAPPHVVEHVVRLAERTASEVWTDALPGLMEMDLRHAVPRIRVPALVLVGEHDRVTPPAAAVELAGTLPDGRLAVLQGSGHIPMLEHPDDVTAAIDAFARTVLGMGKRRRPRKEGAA
jgi:pimeloyl-ACP methyl ester carboxylesterase